MWRLSLQLGSRAPNPGERQDEVSGGGRESQEGGCMCTGGWLTLCSGNQHSTAKQASPKENLKTNRPPSAHTHTYMLTDIRQATGTKSM